MNSREQPTFVLHKLFKDEKVKLDLPLRKRNQVASWGHGLSTLHYTRFTKSPQICRCSLSWKRNQSRGNWKWLGWRNTKKFKVTRKWRWREYLSLGRGWRKHLSDSNDEVHTLYSTTNVTKMVNSRKNGMGRTAECTKRHKTQRKTWGCRSQREDNTEKKLKEIRHGGVWTGLIWHRTATSGGFVWIR